MHRIEVGSNILQANEEIALENKKVDLVPYSGVALDELINNVLDVNPDANIFPTSCRTEEGIDLWTDWLTHRIEISRRANEAAKTTVAQHRG